MNKTMFTLAAAGVLAMSVQAALAQDKGAPPAATPPPAWHQGKPPALAESKLAPVAGKLTETPNDPKQESPVRGDGGLYSTAQDYGRFMRLFLNGGSLDGAKVLSPKTIALMGQNHIGNVYIRTQPDGNPVRTRPFPIGAGKDKFGLGFQITAADPKYAHFRAPGSLSWGGINNTHFWIDPKKQVAAAVMVQVLPFYDDASLGVLRGIEEIVYKNLK